MGSRIRNTCRGFRPRQGLGRVAGPARRIGSRDNRPAIPIVRCPDSIHREIREALHTPRPPELNHAATSVAITRLPCSTGLRFGAGFGNRYHPMPYLCSFECDLVRLRRVIDGSDDSPVSQIAKLVLPQRSRDVEDRARAAGEVLPGADRIGSFRHRLAARPVDRRFLRLASAASPGRPTSSRTSGWPPNPIPTVSRTRSR